jgi:hypothetical protein
MTLAAKRDCDKSPFLLATSHGVGDDRDFQAAFSAAVIVHKASAARLQNTRAQVCGFLCEVGRQLQRGRAFDFGASLPLSRTGIADATGISLTRVKRALALLSMSNVIAVDGDQLTVIDWKRACDYAKVDPATLKICPVEDQDEPRLAPEGAPVVQITLSGEPANFV